MMKTLSLMAVLVAYPSADPVTGSWQLTGDVGGYPLRSVCALQQDGAQLKGTCTLHGKEPSEVVGEVKEGKFTFKHSVEGEAGTSTLVFAGSVASPAELTGTVTVQEHGIAGGFTATPAPAGQ